ncbi:sulfotransferase family [Fragilaria crotonensis]|nr:sulfotransferase family [Fragilaria crotonensis]
MILLKDLSGSDFPRAGRGDDEFSEYTRATFVRDPKDRFLSTFLDKVMSGDASIKQACSLDSNEHLDRQKVCPTLNFVGHLETAEADARSLLERIGAWEAFGSSGWGEHDNEAIFATKDKLTDVTSSELSGSWDLLSKLMTPRIESTLELFYEEDYSIREFGLPLKKIPFPVEMSSSLQSKKMFSNKQTFNKVHIIMFETSSTEQYEENSSLGFFLQTSERVGIETTTFGAGTSFKGWGDKYLHIRDILKEMSDDTLVVVSDARDVLLNVPDRESAAASFPISSRPIRE